MEFERYYKPAFIFGWIANLALWLLAVFVLVKCWFAPIGQPFGVVFAFAAFALLFVLFSIALAIHLKTRNYISLIITIVFIILQFICVLLTTITIFSDERIYDKWYFSDNPTAWITKHRWLPILFSVVFLPLFIIQIFVINRQSQTHQTLNTTANDEATDFQRKATPYHPQEKDYMP